jgi:hypothetical protein
VGAALLLLLPPLVEGWVEQSLCWPLLVCALFEAALGRSPCPLLSKAVLQHVLGSLLLQPVPV